MVDAAALASDLEDVLPAIPVSDDPAIPVIECTFSTQTGTIGGFFSVQLNLVPGEASP